MRLVDRFRRWWNPAKWREEHPEAYGTEGEAFSEEPRRLGSRDAPGQFERYGDEHTKGM